MGDIFPQLFLEGTHSFANVRHRALCLKLCITVAGDSYDTSKNLMLFRLKLMVGGSGFNSAELIAGQPRMNGESRLKTAPTINIV